MQFHRLARVKLTSRDFSTSFAVVPRSPCLLSVSLLGRVRLPSPKLTTRNLEKRPFE